MNFTQAIDAHGKWKIRLRMFVHGSGEKLDANQVGHDDQCELGQWIHGEGAKFAKSPQFQQLVAEHAAFHRCAAKVVRSALAGQKAEALALLADGGEFSRCSQQTVMAIQTLARSNAA